MAGARAPVSREMVLRRMSVEFGPSRGLNHPVMGPRHTSEECSLSCGPWEIFLWFVGKRKVSFGNSLTQHLGIVYKISARMIVSSSLTTSTTDLSVLKTWDIYYLMCSTLIDDPEEGILWLMTYLFTFMRAPNTFYSRKYESCSETFGIELCYVSSYRLFPPYIPQPPRYPALTTPSLYAHFHSVMPGNIVFRTNNHVTPIASMRIQKEPHSKKDETVSSAPEHSCQERQNNSAQAEKHRAEHNITPPSYTLVGTIRGRRSMGILLFPLGSRDDQRHDQNDDHCACENASSDIETFVAFPEACRMRCLGILDGIRVGTVDWTCCA